MPRIHEDNRVATVPLGESHVMVLLEEIKSSGSVQYEFVLAVFDALSGEPVYFVASEVNAMAAAVGGRSHFLGVFDGDGRANLGSSDDWADPSKFFPKARELAAARFQLKAESEVEAPDGPT